MFEKLKRWWGRPSNPSGNVYYVKLNTPQGVFYKLGYTSKESLYERFSYGGYGDEELIDKVLLFSYSERAWDIEQDLLDHFQDRLAFGRYSKDPTLPLYRRGQSELFDRDALGLDSDIYVLTTEVRLVEVPDLADHGYGCLAIIFGVVLAPITLGISLIFVFGGLFEMFNKPKSKKVTIEKEVFNPPKPIHPIEIEKMLNNLMEYK